MKKESLGWNLRSILSPSSTLLLVPVGSRQKNVIGKDETHTPGPNVPWGTVYTLPSFICWRLLLLLSHFSCVRLCDPIDGSPSGSSVPGILQARTLEWVAISFSNARKFKVKGKSLSRARLLATPRTAAHQAPPSMGSSRQEYWSGVPLPSPWVLRP